MSPYILLLDEDIMNRIHEKHIFYIFLIIGLGYFTNMSLKIPVLYDVIGDPGPGFIPFWFSLIAEVLLVYLLVTEVLLNHDTTNNARLSKHELCALSLTIILVVVYLLFLSILGFIISTLLFLAIYKLLAEYLINDIKPKINNILISVLFSCIATSSIYFIFGVLFKLSLP